MEQQVGRRRFMNVFLLAMLNLSVMASLRNLPIVAHYGYGLIFFYALVATFAAGVGTGAITEAGTFDVVTQNTVNMWMYSTFSVINKGANDSLQITWTLTAS